MEPRLRLCNRRWGRRIERRLTRVHAWAQRQGLELAAESRMARIRQVSK